MNIIAAIDFSGASQKILDEVERLAKAFSAKVWLIHVADPDPDFVGYDAGPKSVRDQVAAKIHELHKQLQAKAQDLRLRGVDSTALLIQGQTVEKILLEARKLGADMIIVGSHGHGAMYQFLVGSVSEGILRESRCPIFVVPTHERN